MISKCQHYKVIDIVIKRYLTYQIRHIICLKITFYRKWWYKISKIRFLFFLYFALVNSDSLSGIRCPETNYSKFVRFFSIQALIFLIRFRDHFCWLLLEAENIGHKNNRPQTVFLSSINVDIPDDKFLIVRNQPLHRYKICSNTYSQLAMKYHRPQSMALATRLFSVGFSTFEFFVSLFENEGC